MQEFDPWTWDGRCDLDDGDGNELASSSSASALLNLKVNETVISRYENKAYVHTYSESESHDDVNWYWGQFELCGEEEEEDIDYEDSAPSSPFSPDDPNINVPGYGNRAYKYGKSYYGETEWFWNSYPQEMYGENVEEDLGNDGENDHSKKWWHRSSRSRGGEYVYGLAIKKNLSLTPTPTLSLKLSLTLRIGRRIMRRMCQNWLVLHLTHGNRGLFGSKRRRMTELRIGMTLGWGLEKMMIMTRWNFRRWKDRL
jgi:hypothetical protein